MGESFVFLRIINAATKITRLIISKEEKDNSPLENTAYCRIESPAERISPIVAGRMLFNML